MKQLPLAFGLSRGLCLGRGVTLAVESESNLEEPIWIQVARSGKWRGHPAMPLVEFNEEFFGALIANFRRNPAYKAGPDGRGSEPVIPFDYEHASEAEATEGTVPQSGTPAPAWVLELETRSAKDGSVELWALTELGDKAREQVKAKEYRWTSVAVWPNAIDPESGKHIGPLLTSVALTNRPFIKGMAPIAASMEVWGEAETAEEALVGLRDIFKLDDAATPETVLAELAEFERRLSEGTIREDDVDSILYRLRDLVGARRLATVPEVLDEVRRFLAGAPETPIEGPTPPPPTEEANMTVKKDEATLQMTAKLAAIYGVRDHDDAIIKAAEEGRAAQDAVSKLLDLFEAKDMDDLIAAATEQVTKASKAEGLIAALADFKKQIGGMQDAEAEAEAQAVAASMGLDEETAKKVQPIILDARRGCIVEDEHGLPKVDEAKLAKFRERYPLNDEERAHLKTAVFSQPGGKQTTLRARPDGLFERVEVDEGTPRATDRGAGGDRIDLTSYPGANRTAKAIAYLSEKRPGFKALAFREQNRIAGQFLKSNEVAA